MSDGTSLPERSSWTDDDLASLLRRMDAADSVPLTSGTGPALARRFGEFNGLNASLRVLREAADEARAFSLQRLKEIVAVISHRYWAPTAWLFLKDRDELRAVVRRKTGRTDATIAMHERSLVTHVVETGEPYFTNDAPNDPHFRPTLDSLAAMAVPLKTPDGRVIGALCLERQHPESKFADDDATGLTADVTALVPHSQVLESLNRADTFWCPWHPRVHKWDLAVLLRRICHRATEALEGDSSDGIEIAVWSVDRQDRVLNVYGTSGHGTEFIKPRRCAGREDETVIPFESFVGSVADCPPRSFGRVRLGESHSTLLVPTDEGMITQKGHPFLMRYKQRHMGLVEVIAAPIYLAEPESIDLGGVENEDRPTIGECDTGSAVSRVLERGLGARYVLGIYAYGEAAVLALPDPEEMVAIAETLGEMFSAFLTQRDQLAASYFAEAVANSSDVAGFAAVRQEFGEFRKLKEVRIYVDIGDDLAAVDETGALRPLNRDDGNREYLSAVLNNPAIPVRVNFSWSRRPDFLSPEKICDAAGWLPWHDPEQGRFLDIGVRGFGVIRLVRSGTAKPFTPDDELALVHLIEGCGEHLRGLREAALGVVPANHFGRR